MSNDAALGNTYVMAVDIETYDPHLKTMGPGSIRHDGHIIGVGFYCPELDISCFLEPGDARVAEYLSSHHTKVFHNGVYDLDWLINGAGFTVNGKIEDTMTRETLLDAYDYSYALDHCCEKRGLAGKNKGQTIDAWWANRGGKGKAVEHLDEIPFAVVAKYCIQDCIATLDLFYAQQPLIITQDLQYANDIEASLYPWLMETRKNGMIVDWPARRELSDLLNDKLAEKKAAFQKDYGDINIGSGKQLEVLWKQLGLEVQYSEKGLPSFTHDILQDTDHPAARLILEMRGLQKLIDTFIDGQFVDLSYHGRLWPILYPAKRSEGGTVTGRFSSQSPNGQNIPAREDKYGKEVRSLFIPEEGCLLGAFDYKQIEYRLFSHFAIACKAPGWENLEQAFKDNPDTDYHQMTIDLMDWGSMGKEGRHLAKNFNFGSIYGLGVNSFATKFKYNLMKAHPNCPEENIKDLAKSLMDEYFTKVPFAKPTCLKIQETASSRGYVRTIGGRRQRITPDGKLYKIINYLVQGSAGDMFKKAMVDSWNAGVWKVLIPHIMVHDEMVFSIPQTREGYEACLKLIDCMQNAYNLKVPIGVDTEIGPDWGHCTEENWEQFASRWK